MISRVPTQVVPHAENQREDAAACKGDDDDKRAQN